MDIEFLENLNRINDNTEEERESINDKIYEALKEEGFDFNDLYNTEIEEIHETDYDSQEKYLEAIREKQLYLNMPKFIKKILDDDTITCSKFNEALRKLHRFKNISIYEVIRLFEEDWLEFYNNKHPFYISIEELLDDLNFALLQASAKKQFGLAKNIDNNDDEFLD